MNRTTDTLTDASTQIPIPSELKWMVMEFLPLSSIACCLRIDRGFLEFWKSIYDTQFKISLSEKDFQVVLRTHKTYKDTMKKMLEVDMTITKNLTNPKRIRLCMMGEGGAGKYSICVRYIRGEFEQEAYNFDFGDMYDKRVQFRGRLYDLEIILQPNQDEHSSFRDNHISESDGFLLVYNVTRPYSLQEIACHYSQVLRVKDRDYFPMVVVGNKCDKEDDRRVELAEAEKFIAEENWNIPVLETSAKNGVGISEAFETLLGEIFSLRNFRETSKWLEMCVREREELYRKEKKKICTIM